MPRATAKTGAAAPTVRPVDVKRLRADVFEVVAAAQRVLTQTNSPLAFYAAMADLAVSQQRLLRAIPHESQSAADAAEGLADRLSECAESRRATNSW